MEVHANEKKDWSERIYEISSSPAPSQTVLYSVTTRTRALSSDYNYVSVSGIPLRFLAK